MKNMQKKENTFIWRQVEWFKYETKGCEHKDFAAIQLYNTAKNKEKRNTFWYQQ